MRIVPRMILILKWDPPSVSPVIQLIQTQKRHLTIADTKNFEFAWSQLSESASVSESEDFNWTI